MNITTLQRLRTKLMCLKDRIDGLKISFSKDLGELNHEVYLIRSEIKSIELKEKINKNGGILKNLK